MPLPLPTLTRRLNEQAGEASFDAAALRRALSQLHPALLAQILEDAAHPERFARWGLSSSHEAGQADALVHPRLLAALCELAGVAAPGPDGVANAGLLHTYGYLLSNRRTRFGFKRERWTRPSLEIGLGLKRGWLSPTPPEGTLLKNVTALQEAVWHSESAAPPPFTVSGMVLIEEPSGSSVRILTRLIPLKAGGAHAAALFHAWQDADGLRFVTLFPVESSMMAKMRAQFRNGELLIKPRFNAVIPGINPQGQPGRVRVEL